jgi:DNA-binding response OmpR family regulator
MCIVVVEDEPELRELLEVVLQAEGYQVLSFAEPSPVTRLRETGEDPDLFLIDLMLPDMSGIELAERLADSGFTQTPKIAMSASREWVNEARESRLFQETIRKPFEIDDLLHSVGSYTAR